MFSVKNLVDLSFLFRNNEIEWSNIDIFFVFEQIEDLKDGLLLGLRLFELDHCFLSIDAIEQGQVLLSYLD